MNLQCPLVHLLRLVQLAMDPVEAAQVVDRGQCRRVGRPECLYVPSQRPLVHLLRLVLRGLGDMGKTQLAVEFALQHHRQFNPVF
jgi:hypothetical protein